MKDLLKLLKGSTRIASGKDDRGREIVHYLLPNGKVLELVRA